MTSPEIEFSKLLIERARKERGLVLGEIEESLKTIERSREIIAQIDAMLAQRHSGTAR